MTGVHAGSAAYDPVADAVVMAGTVFCEDSNEGVYLYRYALA